MGDVTHEYQLLKATALELGLEWELFASVEPWKSGDPRPHMALWKAAIERALDCHLPVMSDASFFNHTTDFVKGKSKRPLPLDFCVFFESNEYAPVKLSFSQLVLQKCLSYGRRRLIEQRRSALGHVAFRQITNGPPPRNRTEVSQQSMELDEATRELCEDLLRKEKRARDRIRKVTCKRRRMMLAHVIETIEEERRALEGPAFKSLGDIGVSPAESLINDVYRLAHEQDLDEGMQVDADGVGMHRYSDCGKRSRFGDDDGYPTRVPRLSVEVEKRRRFAHGDPYSVIVSVGPGADAMQL